MTEGTCSRCGAPFLMTRPNRKFCSSACTVANNREETKQKRKAARRPACVCPGCERSFQPLFRQHKYCSRTCQKRLETRRRLGIKDPGFIRQCWWCKSDFRHIDGRRDYCSAACAKFGSLLGNIQREYGLSREQYRSAYFRQGGKCAVCRQPERTTRNLLLAVDHDHVTGQFRGLLCSHCNRAIGLLGDDPRVILAAVDYVKKHRQLRLL